MNAAIRKTALFLGLAFLTLFVNLNYIQATRSDDLNDDPRNRRQIIREFGTRRGDILASDNTVLAHSIDSIPGEVWFDDPNGTPDHRRHLAEYFAEQIRQELA